MLKNFQRYFRFYLASFLFALLLVGIRWQAAPLGAGKSDIDTGSAHTPVAHVAHVGVGAMAIR